MHPVERLRALARARWDDPEELAAEAVWALADLAEAEPHALLPSCRRMLQRHGECGPLWWAVSNLLIADDPFVAAAKCSYELENDQTRHVLESALEGELRSVRRGAMADIASADVVVIEVDAISQDSGEDVAQFVVPSRQSGLYQDASEIGVPVWLQVGIGRSVPPRLWKVMSGLISGPRTTGGRRPATAPEIVSGLDHVQRIVTSFGQLDASAVPTPENWPVPAELLTGW